MINNQKNAFEIIKAQTQAIDRGLSAIEQAKADLAHLEALAIKRASGQMIDVKELATMSINTKEEINKAMVNLIESQILTSGEGYN